MDGNGEHEGVRGRASSQKRARLLGGKELLRPFGGYRKTYSFGLVCLVYHATVLFCRRNFNFKNDPLGKTAGQMVGAARSARQNIVEGSDRAATSQEQEFKQYDVARASLAELAGDYEAFVIDANESPWSELDERAMAVAALQLDRFEAESDVVHAHGEYVLAMRKRFGSWLENEDPLIAANSILITIRRAAAALKKQINGIIDGIIDEGGVSEAISHARIEARNACRGGPPMASGAAPECPKCGAAMVERIAKRGTNAGEPFWACPNYPACNGTRRHR